jgi:DNA modification methylase
VASRQKPAIWKWLRRKSGTLNFVSVKIDKFYTDPEEGGAVDESQKPSELYELLIGAATSPQHWVLDLCCGSGMLLYTRQKCVSSFDTVVN